jgi:hypothetical protein
MKKIKKITEKVGRGDNAMALRYGIAMRSMG